MQALILALLAVTDWAQPPAACIEELVPSGLTCLDLSTVANPLLDLPAPLSETETKFWNIDHRPDLNLCRAREVERRERATAGSQAKSAIAWAWMWNRSAERIDEKIDAIYAAAKKTKMPPQILFGALKQESLLSDLGITPDGNNFSCGIGQINLPEWCDSMALLSRRAQAKLGWPRGISCDVSVLPSTLVSPFYSFAMRQLGDRPDYELKPEHFSGVRFEDVSAAFPPGEEKLQRDRFAAAKTFVTHCSDIGLGIWAKSNELKILFDRAVPRGLRESQRYPAGETFRRKCRKPYPTDAYPFHSGWLLADALYNAGGGEIPLLEHYFRMTKKTHESGEAWKNLTPLDLIEALHWGGKWIPDTNRVAFRDVYGKDYTQRWFKSCVVQRHLARVIQYGTRPGEEIARPLEIGGCSETDVPEYRRLSSGTNLPHY